MLSNDCPVTDDVPESIDESSILLKDKRLLILRDCLWYCEGQKVKKIRFSELKKLCNEALSLISEGKQTDMGGSFNHLLTRLESIGDTKNRFLRRERKSSKGSFIIPDIEKIRDLLESKGLVESEHDKDSWLPPLDRPIIETTPTLSGFSRIDYPSDKIKVYRNWKKSARTFTAYGTNLWKISVMHSKTEVIRLSDDNLKELLEFGNKIACEDELRPFQITLEYKGRASLVVAKTDNETFSP